MDSFEKELVKLIEANAFAKQQLTRTPEPDSVTEGEANVFEYSQMLETNMASNYANALNFIYRASENLNFKSALELCCGPGLFSICLAKYLKIEKVVGVDLSKPMIQIAKKGASDFDLSECVSFETGNALDFKSPKEKFDLAVFLNSAHHFESLAQVTRVLENAEASVKPQGLILLGDLARLKTEEITKTFVRLTGDQYPPNMKQDFANSMRAAWLPEDVLSVVPTASPRKWVVAVPKGLPFLQVLVGLPVGRDQLFVREGFNWFTTDLLKSEEAKAAWSFTEQSFREPILFKANSQAA